jgi:hypothetical protein
MAITTLDHVIAGAKPSIHFVKNIAANEAAGVPHSALYGGGMPGPAVAPTSAIGGDALTSYAGQLPMPANSGNTHMMKLTVGSNNAIGNGGVVWLADRLWHNASMDETLTTAQTVDSAAWPARDSNGSTNGEGVMIALEVSTATTNAGAITNTTMTYTNSAGTNSRTATIPTFPATAVAGTFVLFALQAGDTGVRSIQSLTLGTTYGTAVMHLVAFRPLVVVDNLSGATGCNLDAIQLGLPRLYDNTVPFLVWIGVGTTAVTIEGEMVVTQG